MRNSSETRDRHWRLLVLALFSALTALPLQARELAVPAADLMAAELMAVQQLPEVGMAVLLLRAPAQPDLRIFIGIAEAEAIERAWRKVRPTRPLTHELLGDLLEATGWKLERLVIDELRNGQFMAALELAGSGGRRHLLDSRPSDGIALALRNGAPIQVARQVLEAAAEEERTPAPGRGQTILTATAPVH